MSLLIYERERKVWEWFSSCEISELTNAVISAVLCRSSESCEPCYGEKNKFNHVMQIKY